ncbi:MAG TPA: hypothetical protein VIT68_01455 [Candidatus Gracilibacteria bacterium]
MIHRHSVAGRVAVGKIIGLLVGLLIFFGAPSMGLELSTRFALGLILFYVMLGAFVGLMGVMDHHPIFKFKMPYWLRGIIIGVGMHLMLVLLAYDQMSLIMQLKIVQSMGFSSPFWVLIDGAVLGFLMEFIVTRHCGEGMQKLS